MTRINLLPPAERAKAAREQGLALIVLGLVALVIVLGAVYLVSYRQVSDKEDQVAEVQAQIDQAQQQLGELQQYEAAQTQRGEMETQARGIYESRVLWSSILEEVSLVIPENCDLTQMTCAVPDNMQAQAIGGEAEVGGAAAEPGIMFTGDAKTHKDVAEFMTRLGLLPQIYNIRLVQSTLQESQDGGTSYVQFEIDVDLRPFLTPPPGVTAAAPASPAGEGGP